MYLHSFNPGTGADKWYCYLAPVLDFDKFNLSLVLENGRYTISIPDSTPGLIWRLPILINIHDLVSTYWLWCLKYGPVDTRYSFPCHGLVSRSWSPFTIIVYNSSFRSAARFPFRIPWSRIRFRLRFLFQLWFRFPDPESRSPFPGSKSWSEYPVPIPIPFSLSRIPTIISCYDSRCLIPCFDSRFRSLILIPGPVSCSRFPVLFPVPNFWFPIPGLRFPVPDSRS